MGFFDLLSGCCQYCCLNPNDKEEYVLFIQNNEPTHLVIYTPNNLNTTAGGEKVSNPEVVGTIASQPSDKKKQKRVTFQEKVPNPEVFGAIASQFSQCECSI